MSAASSAARSLQAMILATVLLAMTASRTFGQEEVFTCVSDATCDLQLAQALNSSREGAILLDAPELSARLFRVLQSGGCCFERAAMKGTVNVLGEVTSQLSVLRWLHSLPFQGGPRVPQQLLPEIRFHPVDFNTIPDIVNQSSNWPQSFAIAVKDVQLYYYVRGLSGMFATDEANKGQITSKPFGVLFPRLYYMLLYNRNVLARFGIDPLRLTTWDGLLAAAETMHSQDFGDGEPGYAFCLDLAPDCFKAGYLYAAISATHVQRVGPYCGHYWDPKTLDQMILRPAVVAGTSRILGRIASMTQPGALSSCNASNNLFTGPKARCAFTLDWDFVANMMQAGPDGAAQPIGAAVLPGSPVVLNRTSNVLMPCTPKYCPTSRVEPLYEGGAPTLVNRAPFSTMAAPESALGDISNIGVDPIQAASQLWVNSAGVIPGWANTQTALTKVMELAWRARCLERNPDAVPGATTQPIDTEAGHNSTSCDGKPDWADPPDVPLEAFELWPSLHSSLNATATREDIKAYARGLFMTRWHPNLSPDLAVPLATFYNAVLDRLAVEVAKAGGKAETEAPQMQAAALKRWRLVTDSMLAGTWGDANASSVINATAGVKQSYLDLYRQTIGYTPPTPLAAINDGSGGMTTAQLVASIVVPIVVALLLGGVALLVVRRVTRFRGLLGGVKPPGVSPSTTLCVTDIYNSTVLWESLPASVMEAALRLHHDVMRSCLEKHNGYESGCEGDAFILAFHTPQAAALFCLEAQQALLNAPWPEALLEHPDAQEVWVALHAPQASAVAAARPVKGGSTVATASKQAATIINTRTDAASWFRGPGFADRSFNGLRARRAMSGALDSKTSGGWERISAESAAVAAAMRSNAATPYSEASSSGGGLLGRAVRRLSSVLGPRPKVGDDLPSADIEAVLTVHPSNCPEELPSRASSGGSPPSSSTVPAVMPVLALKPVVVASSPLPVMKAPPRSAPAAAQARSPFIPDLSDADVMDMHDMPHLVGAQLLAAYADDVADTQGTDSRRAKSLPRLRTQANPLGGSKSFNSRALALDATAIAVLPNAWADTAQQMLSARAASSVSDASDPATMQYVNQTFNAAMPKMLAGADSVQQESPAQGSMEWSTMHSTNSMQALSLHVMPWREVCSAWWPRCSGPADPAAAAAGGAVCTVFRGLRVRMGLHSGLDAANQVVWSRTTQSMSYTGLPAKIAKAVSDSAAGGMVLVSGATLAALGSSLASLPGGVLPVYLGSAQLDGVAAKGDVEDDMSLYAMVPFFLRPRLALYEPLRGLHLTQAGNLDAPLGEVVVVFLYVVGASALVADLGDVALDALGTFQAVSTRLCCRYGGYVVEAAEGLCLSVFASAEGATLWAVDCGAHMRCHDWPPALLAHELCQEVVTVDPRTGGLCCQQRGPRLRSGLHAGAVEGHVNARTGRLAYRGRVMNRAARIASKAADGQVFASAGVVQMWRGVHVAPNASARPAALDAPTKDVLPTTAGGPTALRCYVELPGDDRRLLVANSVGTYALKGVNEIMELYSCSCTVEDEEGEGEGEDA